MAEEQAPIPQPAAPKKKFPVTWMLIIIIALLASFVIYLLFSARLKQETSPTPTTPTVQVTPTPEITPTLAITPTPLATPTTAVDDTKLIKQAILNKLGLTENQAVVTISQNTGQYAKGGVKEVEAVGGGYFLAAKVGGNWVIVYDGQANPTCAQLAPYNFPIDMVPECLDNNDKVVKR